ncbi:hypothetical protein [Dactylosporangium sp. NPDC051541]
MVQKAVDGADPVEPSHDTAIAHTNGGMCAHVILASQNRSMFVGG